MHQSGEPTQEGSADGILLFFVQAFVGSVGKVISGIKKEELSLTDILATTYGKKSAGIDPIKFESKDAMQLMSN